jgi:hypothetical protein
LAAHAEFVLRFGECLVKVFRHECPHDGIGPEPRVGRRQELGDPVGVSAAGGGLGGPGPDIDQLA